MYAVAKEHRSAKLFVKSRRAHIPQKLDNFDNSIKQDAKDIQLKELCSTKPIFSTKRFYVKNGSEEISAQHEAMIRYINESWKCIKQELEYSHKQTNGDNRNNSTKLVQSKIQYINGCTNGSIPKNFVPFDLDSFWGQRLYQNLLQSS